MSKARDEYYTMKKSDGNMLILLGLYLNYKERQNGKKNNSDIL